MLLAVSVSDSLGVVRKVLFYSIHYKTDIKIIVSGLQCGAKHFHILLPVFIQNECRWIGQFSFHEFHLFRVWFYTESLTCFGRNIPCWAQHAPRKADNRDKYIPLQPLKLEYACCYFNIYIHLKIYHYEHKNHNCGYHPINALQLSAQPSNSTLIRINIATLSILF